MLNNTLCSTLKINVGNHFLKKTVIDAANFIVSLLSAKCTHCYLFYE